MKLHLTKGLLAALLICFAAVGSTALADVTVENGKLTVTAGGGKYTAPGGIIATDKAMEVMTSTGSDVILTASGTNYFILERNDGDGLTNNWSGSGALASDLTLDGNVGVYIGSSGGLMLNGSTLTVTNGAELEVAGVWSKGGSDSALSIGTGSTVTLYQYGTDGSPYGPSYGNLEVTLNGGELVFASTKEQDYNYLGSNTTFSGTGTLATDGGSAVLKGTLKGDANLTFDKGTVGDLSLQDGMKLTIAADVPATEDDPDSAKSVSIKSGAKIVVDATELEIAGDEKLSGDATITLKNGATLSGDGSLQFTGAEIVAEGTGNTLSLDLKQEWNVSLNVKENGELTFSGELIQIAEKAKMIKNGDGLLAITTAEFGDGFQIEHHAGTLDLSAVTTLQADSLLLKSGSTLVLGDGPLQFTGTLKVEDGAIIDLSAWDTNVYDFYDVELFTGGTTLEFVNGGEGFVQIYFGGGDTVLWPHWLITHEGVTGSVYAIPEPATATLSLLALAGLAAARRRRK